ncbi:MAG: ribosomal small subunit Rsm22 [Clostridiales bacterium GWF2_38_85]|nr:MAG: ribosomal small subunit Rsm22 [Clostridiales bacterium GWF2_38_85]HBL85155.1 rRNA methyltransferase [Clostridiales bacterium]
MEIPYELRYAIENITSELKLNQLIKDAQNISNKYRAESGTGKRLVTSPNEVIAYSVTRMPATYGAVLTALKNTLDLVETPPHSLLDAGAGTGSATWATHSLLELESMTCFEREGSMSEIGRKLMSESESLSKAKWVNGDILKSDIPVTADLVIASYVFNEMNAEERTTGILKLWAATKMLLLIVEPGTPAGYKQIMNIRKLLLENGGKIAAPCPHDNACPLDNDNWCHFSCRVPRSKLHKELKSGNAPYEDEKFSYIAVVRDDLKKADARILRHPYIEKGQITLELCKADGLKQVKITKRDENSYKQAKKAGWGDGFNYK